MDENTKLYIIERKHARSGEEKIAERKRKEGRRTK